MEEIYCLVVNGENLESYKFCEYCLSYKLETSFYYKTKGKYIWNEKCKTCRLASKQKPIVLKIRYIKYRAQKNAQDGKRRALKVNAMVKWADKNRIKEIYKEAIELTNKTGLLYEVDHIIPLTHKLVCGLHVENNLQVIPKSENRRKSNKFTIT